MEERRLVGDLLTPGDVVVLVIPLDSAAPKGRIILPQQQVMRDALGRRAPSPAPPAWKACPTCWPPSPDRRAWW